MATAQRTLRVLVVDDHPVVRQGLRAMLSSESWIEMVDDASSGEDALEKVNLLEPDVVLVDIRMPGMSGIEVTKRIKAARPETAVILLTMYDSEVYVAQALRAGAAGYLLKDSSRELLLRTIDAAVSGGTIVRSGLLRKTIHGLSQSPSRLRHGQADVELNERFTPRELEVVGLVAQGYPNRAIAEELSLAQVTVKKHVQSIIAKLGVDDRTQVAIMTIRMGLAQPPTGPDGE